MNINEDEEEEIKAEINMLKKVLEFEIYSTFYKKIAVKIKKKK